MLRFFRVYQYVVPAVLFPVSYVLWLQRYEHNHKLVILTLSMPVLFAYVIPGIGTNRLKLWEFNTGWKPRCLRPIGKFRPHHGFVFGTATSLLALLCLEASPSRGLLEIARAGFVVGTVLAFWNWIYDIAAIRAGFITVYNRPYHDQRGPEAIATDYAPVLFGTFGACYGLAVRLGQYCLVELGRADLFWWSFVGGNVAVLTLPVVAFVLHSHLRHGERGLRSYAGG